jgi:wyosine [tRNA(Phe)-imidazoG37] synthetase (radical SAM superfamily)
MTHHYLFGPVPSRRLGVSLGIDIIPAKTCSFNCIYCESGRTTNLTIERREYTPSDDIIAEIDAVLSLHPHLDYVTFSGSGEPTLHSGIGKIILHLKDHFPEYRVALLTNGSLFWMRQVRQDVLEADVIIPSLDAVSDRVFRRIDRPHRSLSTDTIIEGLEALRSEFPGELWLEVFIVPGLNDTVAELSLIKAAIRRIRPDKVQLNTLDRPGAVEWIKPLSHDQLEDIAAFLDYPNVEVIGSPVQRTAVECFLPDLLEEITEMLKRRPCTLDDLSAAFGLHRKELTKYLDILLQKGIITEKREERGIFYVYQRA